MFLICLLQLYTGRPPFHDLNDHQVNTRFIEGSRPGRLSDPPIPAALWDLMQEWWAQNAVDRPSAHEVAEALDLLVAGIGPENRIFDEPSSQLHAALEIEDLAESPTPTTPGDYGPESPVIDELVSPVNAAVEIEDLAESSDPATPATPSDCEPEPEIAAGKAAAKVGSEHLGTSRPYYVCRFGLFNLQDDEDISEDVAARLQTLAETTFAALPDEEKVDLLDGVDARGAYVLESMRRVATRWKIIESHDYLDAIDQRQPGTRMQTWMAFLLHEKLATRQKGLDVKSQLELALTPSEDEELQTVMLFKGRCDRGRRWVRVEEGYHCGCGHAEHLITVEESTSWLQSWKAEVEQMPALARHFWHLRNVMIKTLVIMNTIVDRLDAIDRRKELAREKGGLWQLREVQDGPILLTMMAKLVMAMMRRSFAMVHAAVTLTHPHEEQEHQMLDPARMWEFGREAADEHLWNLVWMATVKRKDHE